MKLGYCIVDKEYDGKDNCINLIYIPDGKQVGMSAVWDHLRKCKSGNGKVTV